MSGPWRLLWLGLWRFQLLRALLGVESSNAARARNFVADDITPTRSALPATSRPSFCTAQHGIRIRLERRSVWRRDPIAPLSRQAITVLRHHADHPQARLGAFPSGRSCSHATWSTPPTMTTRARRSVCPPWRITTNACTTEKRCVHPYRPPRERRGRAD